MISKEDFIEYIYELKELRHAIDTLNSAGKGALNFSISFWDYEDLVINILKNIFDDKENEWIPYYLYDLDYGSKWHEMSISIDGKDVPMRDAGELYDVLIDNMKGRSDRN